MSNANESKLVTVFKSVSGKIKEYTRSKPVTKSANTVTVKAQYPGGAKSAKIPATVSAKPAKATAEIKAVRSMSKTEMLIRQTNALVERSKANSEWAFTGKRMEQLPGVPGAAGTKTEVIPTFTEKELQLYYIIKGEYYVMWFAGIVWFVSLWNEGNVCVVRKRQLDANYKYIFADVADFNNILKSKYTLPEINTVYKIEAPTGLDFDSTEEQNAYKNLADSIDYNSAKRI